MTPPGPDQVRSPRPRLPGEPGVWIFVLVDMSFFGLLFASYVYEQSRQPALFYQSQGTLDARLGLANTVILLTSSWLVALAVAAAREGATVFRPLLRLAIACGGAFAVVKGFEYHARFAAGTSMLSNDFYMFYFVITAIHLVHLAAGLILLAVVLRLLRDGADPRPRQRLLESAATYWHMVDLLWVMILALLYQVGWRWA